MEPRLHISPCPPRAAERLQLELGVSNALAQVLVRRELAEPQLAAAFLAAGEEHPPDAFRGISQAIALIRSHVRDGERITIHGDYDVDGICSTAVLVRALRRLGANVGFYLPDRAADGYGLNADTVRRLAAAGTRLLVTVDCGVTAVAEVALAQELGVDVIVSDHHAARVDGALPRAPLVHPALCGYPFAGLCATAVAFKLAQGIWRATGRDERELEEDLDLVALATVADVVPLVGENRTLVRCGLRALARTRKPGLRALMAAARIDASRPDERALAFALAPRLNAAGRLHRADAGLELILTESPQRAREVAEELDRANRERRLIETRIRYAAEAQIAELGQRAAYVLASPGWHAGVIGIVASRLSERHHRPVVLIALGEHRGKGSGRSIAGFDLLAGLSACDAHLLRYGGHSAAAGIEIDSARVQGFATALCEHAERTLASQDMVPVERVDAVVEGGELGMALAEELQQMAPFGHGNPRVSLLIADAVFRDCRPMGEGKHVRFTVESRGARSRAVAFSNGGRLPVEAGAAVEATFTLEINEWAGVSEPRLVLRHARPCRASQPVPVRRERTQAPSRSSAPREQIALFATP